MTIESPRDHLADATIVERGERVYLRPPSASDRAEFIKLRRDSREHLERWEPLPRPGFDAWGRDAFELECRLHGVDEQQRLFICRAPDGAIVGRLSIGAVERGPLQSGRFGYWIGADQTRQGFMSDALRLGLRHCFTTMGLHRVSCNIVPDNEPSKKAALNAGFRLEGYSPRYVKIAGVWRDHERYALTIEDWKQSTSPWRKPGADQA